MKNHPLLKKFLFTRKYRKTYAQCGEDVIIDLIFEIKKIKNPNFLDIGSNDPILYNNPYFFYLNGCRGVLVEPNKIMWKTSKKYRPKDVFLNCGVATGQEKMSNYYMMDWHEFNTFSKPVAEATELFYKGRNSIKKVVPLPMISINSILEKYFPEGLDLLSLDTEGIDYDVLTSLDFSLYRPKVICVETFVLNVYQANIPTLLISKGYRLHSQTPINSIFVFDKPEGSIV
jgi:hypothetical protein